MDSDLGGLVNLNKEVLVIDNSCPHASHLVQEQVSHECLVSHEAGAKIAHVLQRTFHFSDSSYLLEDLGSKTLLFI